MAKRTTPRAEANDTSTPAARSRTRRAPATGSPEADTIGAYPGVERSEDDGAVAQALANPAPEAAADGEAPSDEEIRKRAYQRFLERGSHHGNEFDDWVEAERELRKKR